MPSGTPQGKMCRAYAGGLYRVTRVRDQLCGAVEETQGGNQSQLVPQTTLHAFQELWEPLFPPCVMGCTSMTSKALSFNIASTLLRIQASGTHAHQHTLAHACARAHTCIRSHIHAFFPLPCCSGDKSLSKRVRVQLCSKGKEEGYRKLLPFYSYSFIRCNHGQQGRIPGSASSTWQTYSLTHSSLQHPANCNCHTASTPPPLGQRFQLPTEPLSFYLQVFELW